MKIVFVTNQKIAPAVTRKSSSREIRGYGTIGTIVSPLMDSPDPGKRRKKTGTSEKLTVVSKPKLGDAEVKKMNDEMCFQLDDRLEHIESIEKHFKPDGTVVVVLKGKKEELYQASSEMVERYEDQHKVLPPGGLPKKVAKYDSEILAQVYVAFAIKTGKDRATQDELFVFSRVSQPTWGRYFREPKFWDNVMKRLEVIWNVHTHAKEMYEKSLNDKDDEHKPKPNPNPKPGSDGTLEVDDMTEVDPENTGKLPEHRSNSEERKVLDRIDIKLRFQELGKTKLIRKLLATNSILKKNELEASSLDQLVELAYHLVA